MNFYRTSVRAKCPSNSALITYHLEIRTRRLIKVEDIVEVLEALTSEPTYHEDLADKLWDELGGITQTLTAHHHGVDIETTRP